MDYSIHNSLDMALKNSNFQGNLELLRKKQSEGKFCSNYSDCNMVNITFRDLLFLLPGFEWKTLLGEKESIYVPSDNQSNSKEWKELLIEVKNKINLLFKEEIEKY